MKKQAPVIPSADTGTEREMKQAGTLRWMGVILCGLLGGGLVFLSLGGAFATWQQAYEAWWIFLLGLPIAAIFLGTSWALGTRRRVRPVAGILVAIAALVYTLFLVWFTIVTAISVARSPHWLAGLGFVPVVMFWPIPVLLIVLAGGLLWKQGARLTPYLFAGIALGWLIGWAGFCVIFPELLGVPEAWPVHPFFLLPLILALGFGIAGSRGR